MTASDLSAALRRLADGHSCTIALGDGVGAVNALDGGRSIGAELSAFAAGSPGVTLILGWSPVVSQGIVPESFTRIVPLMPDHRLIRERRCPGR